MFNRLEAAAESLSPWIGRLREAFAGEGCWAHQMSGSGSSYFGIARHAAHARQVAAHMRARGLGHAICTRTMISRDLTTGGATAA
jgi:4-diphosphocytidyl-2-C-methyl-D-erythritol kinase